VSHNPAQSNSDNITS